MMTPQATTALLADQRAYFQAVLTDQEPPPSTGTEADGVDQYLYISALFVSCLQHHVGPRIIMDEVTDFIETVMNSDSLIPPIARYMMYEVIRSFMLDVNPGPMDTESMARAMFLMVEFIAEYHGYDAALAEELLDKTAVVIHESLTAREFAK